MCTMIAAKHPLTGQAKSDGGWFEIKQLYIAYDHPERERAEHAVLIDFANEDEGVGTRLAVELNRREAATLARHILESVEMADDYEGNDHT